MKTLVIHPCDETTDFLIPIYEAKGFEVVDYNISHSKIKKLIAKHDRVIMLGHGDDSGLFGFGRYVVDSSLVYALREKTCICIWCHADKFVNQYGLKGFYTGMFVSEEMEARIYGLDASWIKICESNDCFAEVVGRYLDSKTILIDVIEEYYQQDSEVVNYNRDRLYLND